MGNFGGFLPTDNALYGPHSGITYEFRYEGPIWLKFTYSP